MTRNKPEGWTPRCAGCGGPVDNPGDTCSYECYQFCAAEYASDAREYVRWMSDLSDQPWYSEMVAAMERMIEAYDWDKLDTLIHEE